MDDKVRAFWEGIAVANCGKIKLSEVVGSADIVLFDFDPNYNAKVTLADGKQYHITGADRDSEGKITNIYITDGSKNKVVECIYDDNGYLISVGTVVVADVASLNIEYDAADIQTIKDVVLTLEGQTVVPDAGYDGIASVIIPPIALESKEVTPTPEAQTITAESALALNKVVVHGDSNLSPENIRKEVSIFGIVGTLEDIPDGNNVRW